MTTYKSRNDLKLKFQRLSKPKQQDFYDWIDAFVHRDDNLFELKNKQLKSTIYLDGHNDGINSKLTIGGNGFSGVVALKNNEASPKETILLKGGESLVSIKKKDGNQSIGLYGESGKIILGGNNQAGRLEMHDEKYSNRILLDSSEGKLTLKNEEGSETIVLNGELGKITLGGYKRAVRFEMVNENYSRIISLDSSIAPGRENDYITLRDSDGKTTVNLSANQGRLRLENKEGNTTIDLNGELGEIKLGGKQAARFEMNDENYSKIISLDSSIAPGRENDFITLRDSDGKTTVNLSANQGRLRLENKEGNTTIDLNGELGEIKLGGKQAARFEMIDENYSKRISLDSSIAPGRENDYITLRDSDGKTTVNLSANQGRLRLENKEGNTTIDLNGELGEIKVNGNIMKVPDFVFSKKYTLPSLVAVNNYIQKKRQLPDMPSAQEIKENGLNLTDFSMKLLQKIEELTLYVIDLQNQINELKTTK